MQINFVRATKIWFSFTWRSMLLGFAFALVLFPLNIFVVLFSFFASPGEFLNLVTNPFGMMMFISSLTGASAASVLTAALLIKILLLWLVNIFAVIAIQALAMRWTLKARWSDFKLVAVPAIEVVPENPLI